MTEQKTLSFRTRGGGTHDFAAKVERVVRASKLYAGTCNLFLQHTGASLILREKGLADVRLG